MSDEPSPPDTARTPEPVDRTPEPVGRTPWQRLLRAVLPRGTRAQLLAAVLCGLLGFGAAVQVRLIDSESSLRGARQSDLIGILDTLSQRADRLRSEVNDLRTTRDQLSGGADQRKVALSQARQQLQTLGILAGTLPAQGSGVQVTVSDPEHHVEAADILDAVEELRDAGAEAIQIDTVRVVASTYFTDQDHQVQADGTPLQRPFRIVAVGDPETMATALGIPGGVEETLQENGASVSVTQRDQVTVSALRPVSTPEYARPAPSTPAPGNGG